LGDENHIYRLLVVPLAGRPFVCDFQRGAERGGWRVRGQGRGGIVGDTVGAERRWGWEEGRRGVGVAERVERHRSPMRNSEGCSLLSKERRVEKSKVWEVRQSSTPENEQEEGGCLPAERGVIRKKNRSPIDIKPRDSRRGPKNEISVKIGPSESYTGIREDEQDVDRIQTSKVEK